MIRKKCIYLIFIISLLFTSPLLAIDILFVGSGMIDVPWTTKIKEGLEKQLTLLEIPYSLYEEHLDISRFPNNEQTEIYYKFLSEKFKDSPPDICVLTGNAATQLFTTYADLFPLSQKISIESHIENTKDMTIINLSGDYTNTIEEIKRIANPDHIYIIGDSKVPSRKTILNAIEKTVKKAEIPYTTLSDLSYEELILEVSKIPEGSAIFFTPIARSDSNGNHLIPLKLLEDIYNNSKVPIFGTSVLFLDHGVVGGYISDPTLLGVSAAQLIDGQPFSSINNGFAYYYDWDLVEEFGYKNKIHEDAYLLHKTPTFYELYTTEIYIFSSFLLALILMLLLLMASNRKLSKAKKHIDSENLRLEIMVKDRTQELHNLLVKAAKQSKTDALTELNNRRAFFEEGNLIYKIAKDKKQNFSILMIDIDQFKSINDNYGHSIGDEILKLTAKSIKDNLQLEDISSRIGGEEFAVILPSSTLDEAINIAQNIRKSVEKISYLSEKQIEVHTSISIGVAKLIETDKSVDDILSRADKALYKAKKDGRNQVCSL
ncbi:MAG: diguanylate cyclase [Pleomorphochaeta sp.]